MEKIMNKIILDKKASFNFRIVAGIEFISILIILVILDQFFLVPSIIPQWTCVFLIPFSYIWVIIAKQKAVYPHSFKKHPVCYLGQSFVFGKDNHQAMLWVQGFFIGLALDYIITGLLLRNYFLFNPYLQITACGLYLGAVLAIFMGIVPIDLYRKFHLITTFTLFGLHITTTIVILSYFIYMGHYSVFVPIIAYVGCAVHLIGSTLYLIAYITQRKASLFQNAWFFGTFIGLWACNTGLIEIAKVISV